MSIRAGKVFVITLSYWASAKHEILSPNFQHHSPCQESNLSEYKAQAKQLMICDLSQYARNGRARGELVDKSMFTLTTNCSKVYAKD